MALGLASCSKKVHDAVLTGSPDHVVATVGDVKITLEDFTTYAQERKTSGTAEARRAVLEEMITQEALLHAARKEGLDQSPEFQRAMRLFLITRLEERDLLPLLTKAEEVSDQDVDEALRESGPRFVRNPARRYAWLRAMADGNNITVATDRIQSAVHRFRNLPPDTNRVGFGTVAAEFSDDGETRYQGGDLGWLTSEQLAIRLPPNSVSRVSSLKPRQVSDLIQLPRGVCVILCSEERGATSNAAHIFREKLRQELSEKRRLETRNAFVKSARSALKIEIHEEKLNVTELDLKTSTPQVLISPPLGGLE